MTSSLFLHLGYPKTATTTLQKHLYAKHPEINYLGKYIPGFGYRDDRLQQGVTRMINEQSHSYSASLEFRDYIDSELCSTDRVCTLISSETFIHPWAIDLAVVARRVFDAFSPCKVIIVLREQRDMLWSFYRAHGRYCQYLYVHPQSANDLTELVAPVSAKQWLDLQVRQLHRNFAGTLMYGSVLESYIRIFGRENILVLCYEEMRQNVPAFLRKLCGWMNVDSGIGVKLVGDRRENEVPLSSGDLPYLAGEPVRREFMAAIPEALIGLYKDENAVVEELVGVDLSELGYLL